MDNYWNEEGLGKDIADEALNHEIDFIIYGNVVTGESERVLYHEDALVMQGYTNADKESNEAWIEKHIHPEDLENFREQLQFEKMKEIRKLNKRLVLFYRLRSEDGSYCRKKLTVTPYSKNKDILIFVRKDDTEAYEEEIRYQEQLAAALKEAREANQAKGEFLARMSHEIRTPMNAIIGLTYLSKENAAVPKQIVENLNKIDRSAQFLLSFINDILNLSKIESGNIAVNKEWVDMEEFLGKINQHIKEKAEGKNITFVASVRGNLEKAYIFDANKLSNALVNVLQNAVKFTSAEGNISFITEVLNETDQRADFRFEITDNGIGIEKEFLPKIFDAFEQEYGDEPTLYGGTGLGLAITKNIIELMDGKVDVYSEKGKGSTFIIRVSLQKVNGLYDHVNDQKKSKSLDYDFSGKRALIVEDNEINIEIAKNILLHKNFETVVAVNGEEGVDLFRQHEPGYFDVILMDIRMPVMDGLTATKLIRNLNQADSKTIPIIAMTANAFEEDVRKSFEAGMNGHLSKPIDIKKMYSLLDSVIFKKK